MKGGFCVSTVRIVGGRDPGSNGRRLARPRIVVIVAGAADGADGIFECARILMILLRSRPLRLNAISMSNIRRKVCGEQVAAPPVMRLSSRPCD
jgi:hypothetical protein